MTTDFDYDFLCIGSGPAGQRAAVQAAKLRKRVAIVERDFDIGGACLQTGTIPSKTFREAVLSFRHHRSGAALNGSDRPSLTYEEERPTAGKLLSRVNTIVTTEANIQRDQLHRNGIDVVPGTASFVDPNRVLIKSLTGTREISANRILIAVGTRTHQTARFSTDVPGVICSDDILNLQELPRSLVVIGCGVIGIEYASMFAELGVKVTVIDGRSRPLEFLDSEIVDELVHQLRKHMLTFRLGETVESLEAREGPPPQVLVRLESGKRLAADMVLACTGRIGASDTLALDRAGLSTDDRGRIPVDECFRSEVPHIYAAGDIIGYPSLAATSSEQGRLAACHAFDAGAGAMPGHFPIGIYSIPEISMVGQAEHELTEQKVPYETGIARYREIARGQILGDDSGVLKMIFHAETRELLGVHVIGSGATELIHIGQAVLGLGGGLSYFLETVFNYPTLAECYKVAALDAYNKLRLE